MEIRRQDVWLLRPHHALCACYFRGEGYSKAFVENMTTVLQELDAGRKVVLKAAPDVICEACPNLRNTAVSDSRNCLENITASDSRSCLGNTTASDSRSRLGNTMASDSRSRLGITTDSDSRSSLGNTVVTDSRNCRGNAAVSGGRICRICKDEEKVRRFDREVLRLIRLEEGACISWQELVRRVRTKIIESGKRQEVCGDCAWDDICK